MESQISQKLKEDIQQKYNILNKILNNLKTHNTLTYKKQKTHSNKEQKTLPLT
jgi:hypothetical protein